MKFLVSSAFLFFTYAAPKNTEQTIVYNCIFTYLTKFDLMSSKRLITYKPTLEENFNCEPYVDELRENFYDQMEENVRNDKEFVLQKDCIMEKLRSFNLDDVLFEQFIYFHDKTMSTLKRGRSLSDVTAKIERKLEISGELCMPERLFGNRFDEIYEKGKGYESESEVKSFEDLQEDYCHRKHLADTNFIDVKVYNFTINPKNVSIANLDCDKIWDESKQELLHNFKIAFVSALDFSRDESRCFLKTIKSFKFAEYFFKVWILTEIKISEDQKIAERAKFIQFFTNLYSDVLKCVKEE